VARIVAAFLFLESLAGVFYVSRLVSALPGHDAPVIGLIVLRGVVSALQFAGAWMLFARRPPGVPIARAALLGSLVWTLLAVGFNLAPTGVYPWWRWQFSAVYVLYVAAALGALRRVSSR
jgi:hypothetical protein